MRDDAEHVLDLGATEAGIAAVTQRGAVIGLELLFTNAEDTQ